MLLIVHHSKPLSSGTVINSSGAKLRKIAPRMVGPKVIIESALFDQRLVLHSFLTGAPRYCEIDLRFWVLKYKGSRAQSVFFALPGLQVTRTNAIKGIKCWTGSACLELHAPNTKLHTSTSQQ